MPGIQPIAWHFGFDADPCRVRRSNAIRSYPNSAACGEYAPWRPESPRLDRALSAHKKSPNYPVDRSTHACALPGFVPIALPTAQLQQLDHLLISPRSAILYRYENAANKSPTTRTIGRTWPPASPLIAHASPCDRARARLWSLFRGPMACSVGVRGEGLRDREQ